MHDLFFQITLLAVASIASQWIAWRLHVPAILFLLGMGFFLGPALGLLQPVTLLGPALAPAVSAAVAIILFEGSLHLHLDDLRGTRGAVRRIIFIGAPLGAVLIGAAAHYVAGLEMAVAATLGGMLVVTGPTVIMPMLRQARLNGRLSSMLKWEGIVNDPAGILFAVLAYEYFILRQDAGRSGSLFFIKSAIILMLVSAISFAVAHLVKRLFERGHMPEYLKTPFVLTVVLGLFYFSNQLLHESGLIAVTILGMTLTNIHTASLEEIRRFKETITLLLVSGVFLLLTASLDISALLDIRWRSVLFIILLLCAIRPLTIAICSIGAKMTWKEILFVGWIAPRGVVCAAMAGILGPSLVEAGFADGSQIIPIAFAVVVLSVILHSLTIKPLADHLGLQTKESDGLIITGMHDWAFQLAEVLKNRNVPVLLVDNKFMALKEARMSGLPTYYGELLSDEAEYALEFSKYNSLIAATHSPAYNALVCDKFGHDFGRENVFRVPPDNEERQDRVKLAQHILGQSWTDNAFSSHKLSQLYREGWRFRTTRVGMSEKDKTLIIPKETSSLLIVGLIKKAGGVRLRAAGLSSGAKENDQLVIFSKEEAVETPASTPPANAEPPLQ